MGETDTEFDAVLMRRQAALLNEEADRAVMSTMIVVGTIGVLIGGLAFNFFLDRSELLAILAAIGVPVLSALLGGFVGESAALRSRVQAQQLLVLLAIEANQRRASASSTSHSKQLA